MFAYTNTIYFSEVTRHLTELTIQLSPLKNAMPTPVMSPSSIKLTTVSDSVGINSLSSSNIYFPPPHF